MFDVRVKLSDRNDVLNVAVADAPNAQLVSGVRIIIGMAMKFTFLVVSGSNL
jgi:hypothetical protein